MNSLVYNDSNDFNVLIENLKEYVDSIHLEFNDDGILIKGLDKCKTCLIDYYFNKNYFKKFNFINKQLFHLNIKLLITAIKSIKKKENLTLIFKDDFLVIKIENNISITTKKIPFITNQNKNMEIPLIEYDVIFNINSKIFKEICSDICSDTVINFTTLDNKLKMNWEINNIKTNKIIKNNTDYIKLIKIRKDLDVKYRFKDLKNFSNFYKLCENINISFSNEKPLQLFYNLKNDSYLKLLIAPRI